MSGACLRDYESRVDIKSRDLIIAIIAESLVRCMARFEDFKDSRMDR